MVPGRTVMAQKERLDKILVRRGLARSRHQAKQLILFGAVRVNGAVAKRVARPTSFDAQITIDDVMPYVGRGGLKLAAALDAFGLDVTGLVVLDVGASTGGFTHCLVQRGAVRVYAVDVGQGQLHPLLRADPRVVCLEGVDIRKLGELPEQPRLATIDVSFISLRHVLPAVARLVGQHAVLALFKPQFEVGPAGAGKGGVVRRPEVREQACREFEEWLCREGWRVLNVFECPVRGMDGNVEYFFHLWPPLTQQHVASEGGPTSLGEQANGSTADGPY